MDSNQRRRPASGPKTRFASFGPGTASQNAALVEHLAERDQAGVRHSQPAGGHGEAAHEGRAGGQARRSGGDLRRLDRTLTDRPM